MAELKQSVDFKVKFDSDLHEINADTLISALLGISTAVQEINKELQGDKKIEVKVKALDKGSFLIHLSLIEGYFDSLLQYLSDHNIGTISAIIGILAGILTIKKHLKGIPPSEVKESNNVTSIENADGNIISIDNRTYNIYTKNPIIDSALTKSFDTLTKDESIRGINILDKEEKTIFTATSLEFDGLAIPYNITEETTRIRVEVVELNIFKLVFQENYKWEFYYQGNRISAKLKDENFYNTIDQGESFSKGDTLIVELQINQVFDKSVNTYINKSFQINKVIRHIPRPRQDTLLLK